MLRCDVTCHTVRDGGMRVTTVGFPSDRRAATWNGWGDPARRPGLTPPVREFLEQRFGGMLVAPPPPVALARHHARAFRAQRRARASGSRRSRPSATTPRPGSRMPAASPTATWCASAPATLPVRLTPSSPSPARRRSELLRCAPQERIAVVPFGGGTSVVGGVEPLRGGFTRAHRARPARARPAGQPRHRLPHRDAAAGSARAAGGGVAQRPRLHAGPFPAVLRARHHRRLRGDALGRPGLHRLRAQRRDWWSDSPSPPRRARCASAGHRAAPPGPTCASSCSAARARSA